jgi:hypothetical protein
MSIGGFSPPLETSGWQQTAQKDSNGVILE